MAPILRRPIGEWEKIPRNAAEGGVRLKLEIKVFVLGNENGDSTGDPLAIRHKPVGEC